MTDEFSIELWLNQPWSIIDTVDPITSPWKKDHTDHHTNISLVSKSDTVHTHDQPVDMLQTSKYQTHNQNFNGTYWYTMMYKWQNCFIMIQTSTLCINPRLCTKHAYGDFFSKLDIPWALHNFFAYVIFISSLNRHCKNCYSSWITKSLYMGQPTKIQIHEG
jgi:hypothetical protein